MMFFWMLLEPPPIIRPTTYIERQAGGAQRIHRKRGQPESQHRAAILDDHSLHAGIHSLRRLGEQAQAVRLPCQHLTLQPQQAVAVLRQCDQRCAIDLGGLQQRDDLLQPLRQLAGIADHRALMFQRDVRDIPALAAPQHDLLLGHAHVGEEHFVEFRASRHRAQRAHIEAGRLHRQQQVGNPLVLRLVRLGAAQQEHHVGVVRGTGPDLLAVDHEVSVPEHAARLQRSEVAAGAGFGISLAPDDVAADRLFDPLFLLGIGADFEQRRHQHADALVGQPGVHASGGELRRDHRRFHHVRFGAMAAVFARDRAGDIAVIYEQLLPIQCLPVRTLPPTAKFRRLCPMFANEGAHFVLQCPVLVRQAQIHDNIFPLPL